MRIGTIAGGVLTLVFGAVMYPFWPDSAVLGPLVVQRGYGRHWLVRHHRRLMLVAETAAVL